LKKENPHIKEPGLNTLVEVRIKSGNLKVQNSPEEADVFIIAVPAPVTKDKKADLQFVKSAAESILPILRKENLVILESTSPPGTTKDFLAPILARSGLKIGEEVYLAYCPERVLPGRILEELIENDRVIGGINLKSAQKAQELYKTFVTGHIFLTDATTAEMVKLMENTYRDVNIALANEFALICEKLGINVWEAIELANKHPRVNIHKPGPGVGGHCIPIDPWFIVALAPETARLIRTARDVNDSKPEHVLNKIRDAINTFSMAHPEKSSSDVTVALFGLTFKPDTDDLRESPSVKIVWALEEQGVGRILAVEPYIDQLPAELVDVGVKMVSKRINKKGVRS